MFTLAALFSLDAFGGGFVVQSMLALWLFERFELSTTVTGTIFISSRIAVVPAAAPCRRRQVNTRLAFRP